MIATTTSVRIGIYGTEEAPTNEERGCSLWPIGYAAAIQAAGATPVLLGETPTRRSQDDGLESIHGLVWTSSARPAAAPTAEEQRLCRWCRKQSLPLLAVDQALLALNLLHGGKVHLDLARERPEALQHRHPPERGLRHAINVVAGTRLAEIYGEGEIVVNSEHRQAVCVPARDFIMSAQALDGVIEAIEAKGDDWFALGVQWRPASASASGLDIQVFRGLIAAAEQRLGAPSKRARAACSAA
jgi:gamma-glutamyl-gamma-aminobutyrate hydrolase PuuD